MRTALEQIERISGQYGLNLNKDKCVNLNRNTDGQQTFREGEKLINAEDATYLGNTPNSKATAIMEVEKQVQQVNITMWKLNSYRKATEASKEWQLHIFDMFIKSKSSTECKQ